MVTALRYSGGLKYYILPCIANAFPGIATQARQTRSSMLEVIRSDYITTARSKGMSELQILVKHALPNALLPVITVIGNGMGMMLAGTVVIEAVFLNSRCWDVSCWWYQYA